uniref:Uncharacterized protein n=1 Tax=mine drainage metagenome TaxID=410659 RepID=E6QTP3_9ZZZZ
MRFQENCRNAKGQGSMVHNPDTFSHYARRNNSRATLNKDSSGINSHTVSICIHGDRMTFGVVAFRYTTQSSKPPKCRTHYTVISKKLKPNNMKFKLFIDYLLNFVGCLILLT